MWIAAELKQRRLKHVTRIRDPHARDTLSAPSSIDRPKKGFGFPLALRAVDRCCALGAACRNTDPGERLTVGCRPACRLRYLCAAFAIPGDGCGGMWTW